MNTKELRIGNLVEVGGIIVPVSAIGANKEDHIEIKTQQNETIEVSISDVKPVQLHVPMLMKCCEFDEDGKYTLGIDQHRHYLKVYEDYVVLLNKKNEALIHFWDVRSLHQLQNLYYALKGKEMIITIDLLSLSSLQ